jgi:hypothetical protein
MAAASLVLPADMLLPVWGTDMTQFLHPLSVLSPAPGCWLQGIRLGFAAMPQLALAMHSLDAVVSAMQARFKLAEQGAQAGRRLQFLVEPKLDGAWRYSVCACLGVVVCV